MMYFDAGATTLEKPVAVRNAVARAVNTLSSPGRGSYRATQLAEETDYACRTTAAKLFGVAEPENVIFTHNATHGLNIAIHSLVKPCSRVVISGYEHNAVTRPLHAIPNVELTILDTPPFQPECMVEEAKKALEKGVDVCICNHVSNVFGNVQPVEELGRMCREKGVPFVVDASQSAGILPVNMGQMRADFIAMPGHKGLHGPQGTGLLLCGRCPEPLLHGGTGSQSLRQTMPEDLPDRLESGTHNMPGIAGLLEGLRFVTQKGTDNILRHEKHLTAFALEQLRKIEGVKVFYRDGLRHQTGVLSFIVEGYDCEALGQDLGRRGIAVRAGFHCAPLAHRTVKTLKTGTVRFTPSVFNTRQQVAQFAQILNEVIRKK
ncbi:MAG: aminotransferase class V-fold PLP-dependent enzyme [Oscillospiraceae bacterium]|nr:aminotransferase class V-fold PLP-dependent enzyme [Oscillospiraceae bacterium]